MELNDAGRMVEKVWYEIPEFYPGISIDVLSIMPNHVHGIIVINSLIKVGAGPCACPKDFDGYNRQPQGVDTGQPQGVDTGQPQGVAPTGKKLSLPDVVHRFKTLTTNQYINGVKQNNWSPFPGKLWQRNYYEHVIRNDIDLRETREYILNNPKKWHLDRNNPENWMSQRTANNV